MATPQNISQILAALGQRPQAQQNNYGGAPMPQGPQAYTLPGQMPRPPSVPQYGMPPNAMPSHGNMPMGMTGNAPAPYAAPRPTGSGTLNLFDVKPVNSGVMNMNSNPPPGNYGAPYSSMMAPDPYAQRARSRSPGRSMTDRARHMPASYRDDRRTDSFMPPSGPQMGGGRYQGPPDRSTETVMIDASVVGLIIGRQGESMRQIESRTQTKIQFDKAHESSGSMRKCTITGTKPARDFAVSEINRIIDEHERLTKGTPASRSVAPSSSVAARAPGGSGDTTIMVPSKTVGLVIGKGGETIKDIQDRTQCHVNITTSDHDVNGLRPVHLLGTIQQTSYAKEVILEIVNTDVKKLPGMAAPRSDNANNIALGPRGGNENISVHVPSEAVGMIIGKGGETVRDMQSISGCKINVHQPTGRDIERQIELVGTVGQVDHAKSLIDEKVRAVAERNGMQAANRDDLPYGNPTGPPKTASQPVDEPPGGHEAYAAYGGYQNYVAMWYASTQGKQPDGATSAGTPAQYP